ncbi:hypothetical protein NEOLEDRAFT_1153644 [Neolentinus lepideus HHB14362 ss-1]|uniref:S-adenosyl-L-methionine-dependent methyltransferase n=1 Tax=Neolentinus lepideus HHB14362 ss-1 TaxID=1314782 RepID=A0A165VIS2_9AGAM|nr:hypothetical protein NEOLEDRAFT_1153644 [Neolentinus lepideus HHB14362 ss-1]
MQQARNPNFPENLDILPSRRPDGGEPGLDSVLDADSQKDAIEKYGIAGRVWEAAYLMLSYMEGSPKHEFDPPFLAQNNRQNVVLELGSGTGILGVKLAQVLSPNDLVILTDLPDVCPLLRETIEKHNHRDAPNPTSAGLMVRALPWGSSNHASRIASDLGLSFVNGVDYPRHLTRIICSDLVYFPELLAPLLRSLIELSSPPFVPIASRHDLEIIISYKIRSLSKESPFWNAFGIWFTFYPVMIRSTSIDNPRTWRRLGSSATEDHSFVFIARRRPESFSWTMPQNDSDLMNGFGTPWSSDEQFETLLLTAFDDEEDS